jgi:hypothetical protein
VIRISPFIFFFALLISSPASSALNSFAQLTVEDLITQTRSGEWIQCDSESKVWCQNDLSYYNHSGYAELSLALLETQIDIFFIFSPHTLSELQLNLRRDGFTLNRVLIGEDLFDVEAQLHAAETERQVHDVDKKLIRFLNKSNKNQPRDMYWVNPLWLAKLSSDGDMIKLTLVEHRQ